MFWQEIYPLLLNAPRLAIATMIIAALSVSRPGPAAAQSSDVPAWLQKHAGTGDGQIAQVILNRARALHQKKRSQGAITNPCYLAMDATRPSTSQSGKPGRRFYVICESKRSFRAVSSGYGNGRKLKRANFSNGRQCAKNFSNAEGSKLTMGGSYVTAETRTSFKGYYSRSGKRTPFYRTFLLFDGEGETNNARERAIGGHQATFLKWQCRLQKPESPHADKDGYVFFGRLVDYTSGRSNGCTTWSQTASKEIITLVEDNPTTLYIYPESGDIKAVASAVKAGKSLSQAGLYWNETCRKAIGAPKFWPKRNLQPIINKWRRSLKNQPQRVLPVCR
ncbi:murein L,D-transpeptidase catalytic domain family protein [Alisedimentitalea sp. MJ-SS2]|uniref:murein L,D-transpeptidase catalytic domain-containing protein n=1 Tax=Aliisedimentitalea sp. MJ-SS2 TaxID=3049795 RepID=UPI00290EBFDC|nr:murein L,D-transpeptidase catalytic domain family protein [Alisedimentitalea sp. MJ-SS2]MDU8928079.1 murein L,D-transpeptidase catalytic domain family protein [Alisedimentitalea sp. MJ-SS2]